MDLDSNDLTQSEAPFGEVRELAEFTNGEIIGGRYEVISPLGHGGMGVVYRVKQISTGCEFALKTIDRKRFSAVTIRRFQQEVRATFAVEHPNIVKVIEFGLLDDQTPFLVMEIVRGENLSERLERGILSVQEATSIFAQACFGLAYAHHRGIVHRDIKPSNIMLVGEMPTGCEGSVKILDFGIAKIAGHEGGEMQALTKTGEIFGSPLYMSPEQCSGGRVDHRSDIYSLGCVLFEALTGTPPCVGENALSTMMLHQTQTSPTLREASLGGEYPPELEAIAARMIAKLPADRYQDLGKAAMDLAAIDLETIYNNNKQIHKGTTDGAGRRKAKDNFTSDKSFVIGKEKMYTIIAGVAFMSMAIGALCACFFQSENQRVEVAKGSDKKVGVLDYSLNPIPMVHAEKIFLDPDDHSTLKVLADPHASKIRMRNYRISGQFLAHLATLTNINKLDFYEANFQPPGALHELERNPIQSLIAAQSNFNDDSANAVAHMKTLKFLNVIDTEVTDKGITEIATLPNLTTLKFGGEHTGKASILAISKMDSLRELEIACAVNDEDLSHLTNPKIKVLKLTRTKMTDATLEKLARLKFPEHLILKKNRITVSGLEAILKSKSLKHLSVSQSPNVSDALIRELREKNKSIIIDVGLPDD